MKVEEIKIDNLELEYLKNIHKGVQEFVDLIESMEKELPALNVKIAFMSGMVGYSCQAIVHEKKENYFLISTTNNKKYITGDPLNYYLFDSEYSLYNILMGQFHKIFPNLEIPKIQPFIERVTLNLGNDKYIVLAYEVSTKKIKVAYTTTVNEDYSNYSNITGVRCEYLDQEYFVSNLT